MTTRALEILEPGLLTTVQDRGRYGYQRFGVPVSGATDLLALRAANLLVDNDQGAAALEMTVLGPKARFLADSWIAVTGGDLTPALDGQPLPMWQPVKAPEGSVVSFSGVREGMRGYLALAGGIDVPLVMGSRSTYVKGAFGGFEGRPLRRGDVISTLPAEADVGPLRRQWPSGIDLPTYGHSHEIRVVLGPQREAFTSRGVETLLSSEYSIALDSDRMGYRLEGPAVEHESGPDIVSDGTPLGAVQIPGDGQPMILLADRGTTGGYAKVATVISVDISTVAQAMPADKLTFKSVSLEEAHSALREREELLDAIRTGSAPPALRNALTVLVDGEGFEVQDETGETIASRNAGPGTGDSTIHAVKARVGDTTYEFEVEVRQQQRPERK